MRYFMERQDRLYTMIGIYEYVSHGSIVSKMARPCKMYSYGPQFLPVFFAS
jgi:hypothetical protein